MKELNIKLLQGVINENKDDENCFDELVSKDIKLSVSTRFTLNILQKIEKQAPLSFPSFNNGLVYILFGLLGVAVLLSVGFYPFEAPVSSFWKNLPLPNVSFITQTFIMANVFLALLVFDRLVLRKWLDNRYPPSA